MLGGKSAMDAHRIVIVDDHPLFRDALDQALQSILDSTSVRQAGSLDELIEQLQEDCDVDLILLDLNMPGVQGFSGLLYLRAQHPEVPVMIISATEDPGAIRRAIDFGVSGFVPKSQPIGNIRTAVQTVLSGEVWTPPEIDLNKAGLSRDEDLVARLASLTPQQVRVLIMLGEGLLNKQIAYQLGVSEATIKAHVSAILQKLGVDSRTQAVIAINRIGSADWQNTQSTA
jgi:DNA-binding NarL/FixJ family response regulator